MRDNSSVDFDAYYLPEEDFGEGGAADDLYYEDESDCEVEYDIFGNPHLISETKVTHNVRGNPQIASTTKTKYDYSGNVISEETIEYDISGLLVSK